MFDFEKRDVVLSDIFVTMRTWSWYSSEKERVECRYDILKTFSNDWFKPSIVNFARDIRSIYIRGDTKKFEYRISGSGTQYIFETNIFPYFPDNRSMTFIDKFIVKKCLYDCHVDIVHGCFMANYANSFISKIIGFPPDKNIPETILGEFYYRYNIFWDDRNGKFLSMNLDLYASSDRQNTHEMSRKLFRRSYARSDDSSVYIVVGIDNPHLYQDLKFDYIHPLDLDLNFNVVKRTLKNGV